MGAEKATKYQFTANGREIKTQDDFTGAVFGAGMDFAQAHVQFKPGEGGIIHDPQSLAMAVVRHSDRIPHAIDPDGTVVYGGTQSVSHIEASMARVRGPEATRKAGTIVESLKQDGLTTTSENHGGVFMIGNEAEMWTSRDGMPDSLPPGEQEELHANLWETATVPTADPREQTKLLALDVIERVNKSDAVINGTSVPLVGDPYDLKLNENDGPLGKYVAAVSADMYDRLLHPKDPISRRMWDSLAATYGHDSFEEFKKSVGDLRLWAMAAAHASLGLAHETQEDGRKVVSVEEAIAVGDVFNSNMGSVAEWMTYSTPLIHGQRPGINGTYPRDYRAVLRYGTMTAYPANFVGDPQTMEARIADAMVTGKADRLDRASYVSNFRHGGEKVQVASSHGRLRNRITYPNMHAPYDSVGRVEFTGSGQTPDITALVARNSMLQLMSMFAYESLAAGEHPVQIAQGRYSSLARCDHQRYLAHRFNFKGASDPRVATVIDESVLFVDDMREKYKDDPSVADLCKNATFGLEKISTKTKARDLDEFVHSGYTGSISDVMTHMYNDGATPEDISVSVHDFQIKQAQDLLSSQ